MPALLAASAVVWLGWDSVVFTPLKILTVFFHEISHGLAALATGGSVNWLKFFSNQGGLAQSFGGWRLLVSNAGYLGSLLWGCGLILLSAYTGRGRAICGLLGAVLGVVTALYVRNVFGLFFGFASAVALVWAATRLSDKTNDFLIKVVGVTSAFYVIPDIWSDVFVRSCPSDASMLAASTGVPKLVWGALWILLSGIGLAATLRLAARAHQNRLS